MQLQADTQRKNEELMQRQIESEREHNKEMMAYNERRDKEAREELARSAEV